MLIMLNLLNGCALLLFFMQLLVEINFAQLHSIESKLTFCAVSNPVFRVPEVTLYPAMFNYPLL